MTKTKTAMKAILINAADRKVTFVDIKDYTDTLIEMVEGRLGQTPKYQKLCHEAIEKREGKKQKHMLYAYEILHAVAERATELGIKLHHLCTWWDVLEFAKSCGQFDPIKLNEIEFARLPIANDDYTDPSTGRHWNSITNIGVRPTFANEGGLSIETFLLSPFDGATPAAITLQFLRRVREERKFDSPEALKSQILRDVTTAQTYFRRLNW